MTRVLAGCFALFLQVCSARAAVIQVNVARDSGTGAIAVGNSVTLNVTARVNQAASGADGIFTFDNDLIIANIVAGQSQNFQVQSVNRPGTNDALLLGSNGQPTSSGLHAIYGGYLDMTRGVDSPVLLYSVNLLAVSPGTTSVIAGPAVDPYGFDFVLYQSSSPTVLYGPGVDLTASGATGVPLPPGAVPGMAVGFWVVINRFARHRRRSA